MAVNAHYPAAGRWRITLDRILVEGDQVATQVTVTDGTVLARAVTFSTVQDGLNLSQTEYWPDPFPPAAWRARWVEKT